MAIDRFLWTKSFVHLRGGPIDFNGRAYLQTIYESTASRLVIRASRQCEKSTFLTNSALYFACRHPGIHIVCVFPRQEQSLVFSHTRLLATIERSPVIKRLLLGSKPCKPPVMNMRFQNKSEIFIRSAFHRR